MFIYSKEIKTYHKMYENLYENIHGNLIYNNLKLKTALVSEWINLLLPIQIMDYYWAVKNNGLSMYTTVCINHAHEHSAERKTRQSINVSSHAKSKMTKI